MKKRKWPYKFPLAELTRRCLEYKRISARGAAVLLLYYVKLAYILPFAFLQRLYYDKKINVAQISKAPVFIIGHYRSGTTYLHTLLSKDKQFGYCTNYDMICPDSSLLLATPVKKIMQAIIYVFNIKTSMFNNKTPVLDEPAEEDRFLINKGSAYTDYWGFLFPLRNHTLSECTSQLGDERYFNAWKKEYFNLIKLI